MDRGCNELVGFTVGRRDGRLGSGLRERPKRTLAEFQLRAAVHAREVVAPADVALMNGLTDHPPALALDTQRGQVGVIHNARPLSAVESMTKLSVDEPE